MSSCAGSLVQVNTKQCFLKRGLHSDICFTVIKNSVMGNTRTIIYVVLEILTGILLVRNDVSVVLIHR